MTMLATLDISDLKAGDIMPEPRNRRDGNNGGSLGKPKYV